MHTKTYPAPALCDFAATLTELLTYLQSPDNLWPRKVTM